VGEDAPPCPSYVTPGPATTSLAMAIATCTDLVLERQELALGDLPSEFDECVGAALAFVESAYIAALAAIPTGAAKTKGIALGRASAAAIVDLRTSDGSDTLFIDPNYPQGTEPGEWRFTPGTGFAVVPGWGEVTPFALRDSSQYRAPPPYRLTSRQYTKDFREVKMLGGDGDGTPSARTPEQTEIARFWVESSPLQWNRIARTVAMSEELDAWENARLLALLNMALTDGYIGAWEAKYHYKFWRPVTAIREAATDGNPDTEADPDWTPLVATPPLPDHDSGHSVEGGAAAEVLRRFFRTDDIEFKTCSLTLPDGQQCDDPVPTLRSYDSFTAAEQENGESRILVGFHFRKAVEDGIAHGIRIGNRTVDRYLRTVH
jgi:PAP2 superfamily